MTRFATGRVPPDMWICGKCGGPNLIALTNGKCPVCEHERDDCCIGPNQPYSDAAGLFPESSSIATGPSYSMYPGSNAQQFSAAEPYTSQYSTFEDSARKLDWYKASSVYKHDVSPIHASYAPSAGFTSLAGAGSPAPGVWSCTCGATNSELTPDFCPVCGEAR